MGACLVSSLVFLYQGDPGWAVTRAEARQLARLRPEERAAWKSTVWSPTPDTALARDRELGPGDVIAYSDDKFAALLWSEGMRNRVEYVPYHSSRSVFLADLENVHAKWAVIMPGDGYEFLRQSPDWEAVGLLSPNGGSPWYAFRRRRQPQH
jgi:hypothetical protein